MCPNTSCSHRKIDPTVVMGFLDRTLATRYDAILLNRALDTMPDVMWCPDEACGKPVLVSLRYKRLFFCLISSEIKAQSCILVLLV